MVNQNSSLTGNPIPREAITAHLDGLKTRVCSWLEERRYPSGQGFNLCRHAFVSEELNATTGGVELWTLLGLSLSEEQRNQWILRLRSYQNPLTGLVCDPTWRERQLSPDAVQLQSGDTFFTMTCAAALEALSGTFEHPVTYLSGLSPEQLLGRTEWIRGAHHPGAIGDYGRLIRVNQSLGVSGAEEQWEAFLNYIAQHQDSDTGLWPSGHERTPLTPSINRSFHVLRVSWNLANQPMRKAPEVIDACLTASGDERFYGWGSGYACNDLDLAYVLYTASCQSNHREEEVQAWAQHTLPGILRVQKPDGGFSFHHERSMEKHGGIRMSSGAAEGDMWGTLMYLGTVKMMTEMAYPGLSAPWAFSRVHAIPNFNP